MEEDLVEIREGMAEATVEGEEAEAEVEEAMEVKTNPLAEAEVELKEEVKIINRRCAPFWVSQEDVSKVQVNVVTYTLQENK